MDGEIIRNPAQIAQVLRKVQDARSLLVVTLPGENIPYQSAILEIDPDTGYLVLDEITPIQGHKKFLQTGKLVANTKMKGVDIRFTAELDSVLQDTRFTTYRMRFPAELLYMQKRQSFRINLGITSNIAVTLHREDGSRLQGKVVNLSETGEGATVGGNEKFRIAELIPVCEIELPNDEIIQSKLEIRFISQGKQGESVRIGGRFLEMPGIQQRLLARVLLDLQRDMMRRLPKDSL